MLQGLESFRGWSPTFSFFLFLSTLISSFWLLLALGSMRGWKLRRTIRRQIRSNHMFVQWKIIPIFFRLNQHLVCFLSNMFFNTCTKPAHFRACEQDEILHSSSVSDWSSVINSNHYPGYREFSKLQLLRLMPINETSRIVHTLRCQENNTIVTSGCVGVAYYAVQLYSSIGTSIL